LKERYNSMSRLIKFPKSKTAPISSDKLDLDILNFETAMIEITRWMIDGGPLPERFTSDEHGLIVTKDSLDRDSEV
jgi:hypothetical protein